MIATTIDYQKLQDWHPKRLYCCFRFRSLSQALVDTLFGLAMVENHGHAVGILRLSVIDSSSNVTVSGFGGHIAISGCRSML